MILKILPMKFLFLIVSLLFCKNFKDLLKKRLTKENFEPVSADFFQNNKCFVYKIIINDQNLVCTTTELEKVISNQRKPLKAEYDFSPEAETEILKNIYFLKNEEKIFFVSFYLSNIYNKRIQNICQQALNSIKRSYPSLCIIPGFGLNRFQKLTCNFLALDKNYQPAFHIPSIKDGKISTIKITGKDLNLAGHFKNNLLQVIKHGINQKEVKMCFENFDFVKFWYFNTVYSIEFIDTSKLLCKKDGEYHIFENRCLCCKRVSISANLNNFLRQNQMSKGVLAQSEKFINEFLNITSAKAFATMILYNSLPKDTIRNIIYANVSDASNFYRVALAFWLKNNTPRLPIEIDNGTNKRDLEHKLFIFKEELTSEEAEKIKSFYNILAKCEFITVSDMNELFYAFIVCKACAENNHPKLLVYNSNMHRAKEFLGLSLPSLSILESFYTIFGDYKKFMGAIDLKGEENSVYSIIEREIEERLKKKE